MLELPPEKATNLGLGPRNFRKREAPDMSNRSDWTDTPADRLRKEELAKVCCTSLHSLVYFISLNLFEILFVQYAYLHVA